MAAAGHIAADAQPTMRFLQGWSPQHPNFCSLFKRFLPAPSLSYPLRSFLHTAPGGPWDPADLLWGLSVSIWHLLRYKASSPITWEGLGTCHHRHWQRALGCNFLQKEKKPRTKERKKERRRRKKFYLCIYLSVLFGRGFFKPIYLGSVISCWWLQPRDILVKCICLIYFLKNAFFEQKSNQNQPRLKTTKKKKKEKRTDTFISGPDFSLAVQQEGMVRVLPCVSGCHVPMCHHTALWTLAKPPKEGTCHHMGWPSVSCPCLH